MRTIAIINLKGGVAKTTSSINIAYILTTRGYKVLLVDNDKQGDCSRGLNRRTSDGDGIDRIMIDRQHRLCGTGYHHGESRALDRKHGSNHGPCETTAEQIEKGIAAGSRAV